VWNRTEDGFDRDRMGLEFDTYEDVPASADTPYSRRQFFDTRRLGKSAMGHLFPERLSELERRAVLEFLKTL